MSTLFRNQQSLKKQINITIRKIENRQWCVKITEQKIQLVGDNKKQLLALAKAEVLKRLVDSLEAFNFDINQIEFKIIDLSLKSKFSFASIKNLPARRWNNLVEWSREEPYLDYFIQLIITSVITWQIIALLVLLGAIIWTAKSLISDEQIFTNIFVASLAFTGVILTILVNNWAIFRKSKIERQTDASKKMSDYYELIIKVLKTPGYYSLEEIANFIDEFDNKADMYSSLYVIHQWKIIKEKIPLVQANASNTDSKDYLAFKNFIIAIREEIGYSSTPGVRSHIHKELKRRYQNREPENS
jgi:hypothetical protein